MKNFRNYTQVRQNFQVRRLGIGLDKFYVITLNPKFKVFLHDTKEVVDFANRFLVR